MAEGEKEGGRALTDVDVRTNVREEEGRLWHITCRLFLPLPRRRRRKRRRASEERGTERGNMATDSPTGEKQTRECAHSFPENINTNLSVLRVEFFPKSPCRFSCNTKGGGVYGEKGRGVVSDNQCIMLPPCPCRRRRRRRSAQQRFPARMKCRRRRRRWEGGTWLCRPWFLASVFPLSSSSSVSPLPPFRFRGWVGSR